MSRVFKKVDYEQTLELTIRLGDCLPADHLARFIVDTVAQLDLSTLYTRYGKRGGAAYAPVVLQKILSSSKPSLFENCIVAKQAKTAHLLFDKNIFTVIICLILMSLKFFATLPSHQRDVEGHQLR